MTGEPVEEQGCIALGQEDGQPLVEVPDLLRLLFSGMSGQCCTQLLDLQYGRLVPAAQGLHNHGDEDHACLPAPLSMLGHLLVEPYCQGMTRGGGSPVDQSCLERVHHSDVQSSVLATRPIGDEDISRSGVRAWYDGPVFSGRTQG